MILGVIPARGGSKGLPNKNLRSLLGKPLIEWSIEAARRSKLLDRCVVSTENEAIAETARAVGAEVLPRPAELATDDASMLSVLQHVVQEIPADLLVLLQPTSPIREDDLVDRCIEQFLAGGADSLATGFVCTYRAYCSLEIRRQDVSGFFYDDGNVYIFKRDLILAGERCGSRIEEFHLGKEFNVDIDDEFDFWLAEQLLRRRMNAD